MHRGPRGWLVSSTTAQRTIGLYKALSLSAAEDSDPLLKTKTKEAVGLQDVSHVKACRWLRSTVHASQATPSPVRGLCSHEAMMKRGRCTDACTAGCHMHWPPSLFLEPPQHSNKPPCRQSTQLTVTAQLHLLRGCGASAGGGVQQK